MSALRFEFELEPLEPFRPRPASWLGLTDGEYVVQLGDQRVFEVDVAGARRRFEHSVTELLDGLLEVLRDALTPVPASIARRLDPESGWLTWWDRVYAWSGTLDDDLLDDVHEELRVASGWAMRRTLDVGVAHAPRLTLVSIDDHVVVTCEPSGRKPARRDADWVCAPARIELSREAFVDEVARFHRDVLRQMAERIDAIERGALRDRAHVDMHRLRADYSDRTAALKKILRAWPIYEDWDDVARILERLDRRLARAGLTRR